MKKSAMTKIISEKGGEFFCRSLAQDDEHHDDAVDCD